MAALIDGMRSRFRYTGLNNSKNAHLQANSGDGGFDRCEIVAG
jgi:hypothetical protein